MAKNDQKKKSGLHKEISSIFDGVPVPSDRTAPRSQTGPQQGQAGYNSPRPPAQAPENPQIPGSYQRSSRPAAANAGAKGGLLQQIAKRLFPSKAGVNQARQKLMLLLVPLLLVVFVIMLGRVVDIPFLATKEPVTSGGAGSTPPVAVRNEITWQKPALYPAGLRDPMQLTPEMMEKIEVTVVDPKKPIVDELAVTGILYSPDNPSAVIGTQIAHVGDIIAGATIVKINKNSVEFKRDGEAWTRTVEP